MICKEITKYYEEYIRLDVNELENFKSTLRGEITLVLSEKDVKKNNENLDNSDKKKIRSLLKKMTIRDIVSHINQNKDIPKKIIYNYCLELKNEK